MGTAQGNNAVLCGAGRGEGVKEGRAAAQRTGGDGEAGRDCTSKPEAEDIGKTRNDLPVRREGGRTCAVVRGTGERREGGRSKTE